VDASALAAAGFERGWRPWWMTAPLPALEAPDAIPGVEIEVATRMPVVVGRRGDGVERDAEASREERGSVTPDRR
jgi:hypothetical protein